MRLNDPNFVKENVIYIDVLCDLLFKQKEWNWHSHKLEFSAEIWNKFLFDDDGHFHGMTVNDGLLYDSNGKKLGKIYTGTIDWAEKFPSLNRDFGNFIAKISLQFGCGLIVENRTIETFNLEGFYFPFDIHFINCEFEQRPSAKDCMFRSVHFNNCEFNENRLKLSISKHSAPAFHDCEFKGGLTISGKPDRITYMSDFVLSNAKVAFSLTFSHVNFYGFNFIEQSKFDNEVNFRNSKISGFFYFKTNKLLDKLLFSYIEFQNVIPDFQGTELNYKTHFLHCTWPKVKNPVKGENSEFDITHNIATYEHLANAMAKYEKHHEKHMFYRLARRARRSTEKSKIVRAIDFSYEKLSGYGYIIERVIMAAFAVSLIGAIMVFPFRAYKPAKPTLDNLDVALWLCLDALVMSLANTFGFLGLHRGPMQGFYEDYPKDATLIPFSLTWSIQMICGLIIAFLFGLCLRNRFRIS